MSEFTGRAGYRVATNKIVVVDHDSALSHGDHANPFSQNRQPLSIVCVAV